ncbi:MAG: amidohydrolase family protein, partial [Ilumatobacteraceae bacterium]
AKLRDGAAAGTARMALECATLGGAGCLGRDGEIGVLTPGAAADVAVWKLTGPSFAGALADPLEAWLRCGPIGAWHTVVNGRFVVRDGQLQHADVDHMLRVHATHAARIQQLD